MATSDIRTISGTRKGKFATAGRMNVLYRSAAGKLIQSTVLDAGSSSGLKLEVPGVGIVDNVPRATAWSSTNAYHARGFA